jgi:hypothetical protein
MEPTEKVISLSEKIEILGVVLDSAEKEADRMWVRHSWMMTVNTGLLGLMGFRFEEVPVFTTIISVLGIILAVMWYCISVLSHYYESRWFADARCIINSDKHLSEYIRARGPNSRVPRPITTTGTTFVKGVIIAFGIA